jgi:hypothetical protein
MTRSSTFIGHRRQSPDGHFALGVDHGVPLIALGLAAGGPAVAGLAVLGAAPDGQGLAIDHPEDPGLFLDAITRCSSAAKRTPTEAVRSRRDIQLIEGRGCNGVSKCLELKALASGTVIRLRQSAEVSAL